MNFIEFYRIFSGISGSHKNKKRIKENKTSFPKPSNGEGEMQENQPVQFFTSFFTILG